MCFFKDFLMYICKKAPKLLFTTAPKQHQFKLSLITYNYFPNLFTNRTNVTNFTQPTKYRKDTEPFISCFRVLTYNTSFQYLSIHAMSFIACYNLAHV